MTKMITDLPFLLRQAPICEALDGRLTPDEFRDRLNHHIHGYGEWGYEEAERINLRTSGNYDTKEGQELLEQIKLCQTTAKVEIKEIDSIPHSIASALATATQSGPGTVNKARNGTFNYGAVKGFELVGFLSGEPWNDWVSIGGLYVREDYRGQGISNKMFEAMRLKASEEKLSGFAMGNASWNGQDALRGFHRYLGRNDIASTYDSGSEELSNWAELKFD